MRVFVILYGVLSSFLLNEKKKICYLNIFILVKIKINSLKRNENLNGFLLITYIRKEERRKREKERNLAEKTGKFYKL